MVRKRDVYSSEPARWGPYPSISCGHDGDDDDDDDDDKEEDQKPILPLRHHTGMLESGAGGI